LRELFPQRLAIASTFSKKIWQGNCRHQMDSIARMGIIPALFPARPEQWPGRVAHNNNYSRKCFLIVAESPTPASNISERVLASAARILAPLVRLLIAKGVTYQMASEMLKQVYVRVAQKQFVEDDEATGTRLSLLTGLNRKEIKRLTSDGTEKKREPISSYASAVHSVWRTQRKWRDNNGQPKVLPRRGLSGSLSFDELVKSITTDHRPSAIFEELVRLNYVDIDEHENIRLRADPYLATPDAEDRLLRITENLEDHASAAIVNVIEPEPRFLERYVYSDEMSRSSAEELHVLARGEWDKLQDVFVEKAISLEERDAVAGTTNRTRIRVGIYFYSEEASDPDQSGTT
jgi:Family of unknown function (DUF6502)